MQNIVEFLDETCKNHGGRPAIEAEDGALTFFELRELSLRVGGYISSVRGCSCEKKMIAVYLPKGAKCLSAMLGVLYSGNVYVPMDCRAPVNRTKLIFSIVDPIMIITDTKGKQTLVDSGVSEDNVIDYDDIIVAAIDESDRLADKTLSRVLSVDPAYLLFTSGSTGVPKGVVIPHSRVINYITWAREYFLITDNEVIGNQAPFFFTVSAMDIFLCLATGSKLCVIPENLFSKPDRLVEYIIEREITLIFWVSSVYHHIAQSGALDRVRPQSIRRAWFVGEPIAVTSLNYWLDRLPGAEFANLYGSTETDMTICYRVPMNQLSLDSIPLGLPCAHSEVLILNEELAVLEDGGGIGEICIRGPCLALGYFKENEKTAASFTQNPLHSDYRDLVYHTGDLGELRDGLIFFHGRKDHQFKHLGYRIEAGEIEAIALRYPFVSNNCVLYDSEKRQIVLFYTADQQINELEYRRTLMAELPIYMVPTRFIKLDAMPFNANNKKDRILLKTEYIDNEGKHDAEH